MFSVASNAQRQSAEITDKNKGIEKALDFLAATNQLASNQLATTTKSNYKVQILTNLHHISQFEKEWRQLEDRCAKPTNVFQTYDWCSNWVKSCASDNDCYKIYIVTITQNNKCVLIWPMMTTCSGPFHILRWLSEPYSQYGDVLLDPSCNTQEVLNLGFAQIKSHPKANSVRFRHVREDAYIADFLKQHAQPDNHIDYAPCLEIEKFPTEKAYETRYNKSQRRRRKRIRKSLEKFGPVDFSINSKGTKFLNTLKLAITEKRTWLKERGLYSKPIMSDDLETFFTNLAENGQTVETRASHLAAGEKDASFEIGLRFKNYHFGYITAHNAHLTDLSPSRLHMDLSQRSAINDGLDTFDLMVPSDPHKKTWSSTRVQTRDYFTDLNFMGIVYDVGYLKVVRPSVRWLYLRAPSNIRRHFTRLVC